MKESISRRTLAGSSGTYNVRATELAVDRGRLKSINATVVFLDNTQHCFKIDVIKDIFEISFNYYCVSN